MNEVGAILVAGAAQKWSKMRVLRFYKNLKKSENLVGGIGPPGPFSINFGIDFGMILAPFWERRWAYVGGFFAQEALPEASGTPPGASSASPAPRGAL